MATFITPARHGYAVKFSPFNPNEILVATSAYFGVAGSGTLFHLYYDESSNLLNELAQYQWQESLFDVVWSKSEPGFAATASGDGLVEIWNLAINNNNPVVSVLNEHQLEVSSVDWKNNENLLSSAWDSTIKLWDVNKLISKVTYCGHTDLAFCTKFSPHLHNIFASVAGDGTAKIWDINEHECKISFQAHDADVLSCDWNPHNLHILATSGSDGIIRIWDLRTLKHPQHQLIGCQRAIKQVKFSPHESNLICATSYDFTTRLWNYEMQIRPIDTIHHHSEFVYGLDWNLFREQIADCSWDSSTKVFKFTLI